MLTIFAPTRESEGCVLIHTSLSLAAIQQWNLCSAISNYFTRTPDLAIGPLPLLRYPLRTLTLFGNPIIWPNKNLNFLNEFWFKVHLGNLNAKVFWQWFIVSLSVLKCIETLCISPVYLWPNVCHKEVWLTLAFANFYASLCALARQ